MICYLPKPIILIIVLLFVPSLFFHVFSQNNQLPMQYQHLSEQELLEKAQELGYSPNDITRLLRTNATGSISAAKTSNHQPRTEQDTAEEPLPSVPQRNIEAQSTEAPQEEEQALSHFGYAIFQQGGAGASNSPAWIHRA